MPVMGAIWQNGRDRRAWFRWQQTIGDIAGPRRDPAPQLARITVEPPLSDININLASEAVERSQINSPESI